MPLRRPGDHRQSVAHRFHRSNGRARPQGNLSSSRGASLLTTRGVHTDPGWRPAATNRATRPKAVRPGLGVGRAAALAFAVSLTIQLEWVPGPMSPPFPTSPSATASRCARSRPGGSERPGGAGASNAGVSGVCGGGYGVFGSSPNAAGIVPAVPVLASGSAAGLVGARVHPASPPNRRERRPGAGNRAGGAKRKRPPGCGGRGCISKQG